MMMEKVVRIVLLSILLFCRRFLSFFFLFLSLFPPVLRSLLIQKRRINIFLIYFCLLTGDDGDTKEREREIIHFGVGDVVDVVVV